jgi:hypothetical protein
VTRDEGVLLRQREVADSGKNLSHQIIIGIPRFGAGQSSASLTCLKLPGHLGGRDLEDRGVTLPAVTAMTVMSCINIKTAEVTTNG